MPFRIHLLIIACIVVVTTLIWNFMNNPFIREAGQTSAKAQYNITISHASWGLNCRNMVVNTDQPANAFQQEKKDDKLHDDNVLGPVSLKCNGTTDCKIDFDEASLGPDPAPECATKDLEIEYRCFSYDRPWNVKASSGPILIHCDQPSN